MAVACHPYRSNKEAKYPHLPCCLNSRVTHIRGMFSWRIKVLGGQRSMYGLHVVAFCWAHQIHLLHFGVSWWELEALTQYTWFLYSNSGKYSCFPTQTRLEFPLSLASANEVWGRSFSPQNWLPRLGLRNCVVPNLRWQVHLHFLNNRLLGLGGEWFWSIWKYMSSWVQ